MVTSIYALAIFLLISVQSSHSFYNTPLSSSPLSTLSHPFLRPSYSYLNIIPTLLNSDTQTDGLEINNINRKELWKSISSIEKEAVNLLSSGNDDYTEEAIKMLSKSIGLKKKDPFMQLAEAYNEAVLKNDDIECTRLINAMETVGLPPHIANLSSKRMKILSSNTDSDISEDELAYFIIPF